MEDKEQRIKLTFETNADDAKGNSINQEQVRELYIKKLLQ
jgi:hypothetical protein